MRSQSKQEKEYEIFHAKNNKSNHTGSGIRYAIFAGYQESAQGDAAGGGQAYHSVYRGGGCGEWD